MITTSRWILLITENNQQKLILIHRKQEGKEYYVFPWGHREEGEHQKETLIREIKEELNIDITVWELFKEYENIEIGRHEYFYFCEHRWWTVSPGKWPERKENTPENFYEIVKIPINNLQHYNLLPQEIKQLLIQKYL
jgi:8-oxo-dGTP pyrophosphatase MutT (NUDIX family)